MYVHPGEHCLALKRKDSWQGPRVDVRTSGREPGIERARHTAADASETARSREETAKGSPGAEETAGAWRADVHVVHMVPSSAVGNPSSDSGPFDTAPHFCGCSFLNLRHQKRLQARLVRLLPSPRPAGQGAPPCVGDGVRHRSAQGACALLLGSHCFFTLSADRARGVCACYPRAYRYFIKGDVSSCRCLSLGPSRWVIREEHTIPKHRPEPLSQDRQ